VTESIDPPGGGGGLGLRAGKKDYAGLRVCQGRRRKTHLRAMKRRGGGKTSREVFRSRKHDHHSVTQRRLGENIIPQTAPLRKDCGVVPRCIQFGRKRPKHQNPQTTTTKPGRHGFVRFVGGETGAAEKVLGWRGENLDQGGGLETSSELLKNNKQRGKQASES